MSSVGGPPVRYAQTGSLRPRARDAGSARRGRLCDSSILSVLPRITQGSSLPLGGELRLAALSSTWTIACWNRSMRRGGPKQVGAAQPQLVRVRGPVLEPRAGSVRARYKSDCGLVAPSRLWRPRPALTSSGSSGSRRRSSPSKLPRPPGRASSPCVRRDAVSRIGRLRLLFSATWPTVVSA